MCVQWHFPVITLLDLGLIEPEMYLVACNYKNCGHQQYFAEKPQGRALDASLNRMLTRVWKCFEFDVCWHLWTMTARFDTVEVVQGDELLFDLANLVALFGNILNVNYVTILTSFISITM